MLKFLMHSFNYIPRVKHSVLNANGVYFDISALHKLQLVNCGRGQWDHRKSTGIMSEMYVK